MHRADSSHTRPTFPPPSLPPAAAKLGLEVTGVSFHVGSACQNLAAFTAAIASAADIFVAGAAAGHANMTLLDIGGGFSGRFDACGNVVFGDIASAINAALVGVGAQMNG